MSRKSSIDWRKKNPLKYSFQNLKYNARRRNKEFLLTFEQFSEFCYSCEILTKKGKRKKGFTIDRINNSEGYRIENIQKLTRSENSKKGTKALVYDWLNKTAYYTNLNQSINNNLTPF